MQSFVVRNDRHLLAVVASCGFLVSLLLVLSLAVSAHAQTNVYATICVPASTISIDQPVNDSTVTSNPVAIKGSVNQANQIEIYVDGEFDSILPLTIGQSAYSGMLQLPVGTHTVRVEAINSCDGENGEATSVITYTAPPTQPSTGETTPTGVAPTEDATITIGTPTPGVEVGQPKSSIASLGLPPLLSRPLEQLFGWLNISPVDVNGEAQTLSFGRAAVIFMSMYLLIIGLAPTAIRAIAMLPFVISATAGTTTTRRRHIIGIGVRVVSLIVLIGALLL